MLGTELALIVLFLALGLGALGGFASAYAVHWVLIHRMRGIDGLLRANYAIGKRAETRALKAANGERALQLDPDEEIMRRAREQGLLALRPRGE